MKLHLYAVLDHKETGQEKQPVLIFNMQTDTIKKKTRLT